MIIYELGRKIIKTACEFIKNINRSNSQNISVSVNISGIQLLRDEFVDDLSEIIKATGINTQLLELEITESVLLDNFELVNTKLEEIKKWVLQFRLMILEQVFRLLQEVSRLVIGKQLNYC